MPAPPVCTCTEDSGTSRLRGHQPLMKKITIELALSGDLLVESTNANGVTFQNQQIGLLPLLGRTRTGSTSTSQRARRYTCFDREKQRGSKPGAFRWLVEVHSLSVVKVTHTCHLVIGRHDPICCHESMGCIPHVYCGKLFYCFSCAPRRD